MLLLLILAAQTFRLVSGQVGGACTLRNGQGVCQLIEDCQSVIQELRQGRPPPPSHCGFEDRLPIVCCPLNGTGLVPTTASLPIWGISARSTTASTPFANSRPARRMCAEYAKAVYALEQAHAVNSGDLQLVSDSLCSIKNMRPIPVIIGGIDAGSKEFPHMAVLGYKPKSKIEWSCGGTLISDQYVLTAAHCTSQARLGNVELVRVGDLDLSTSTDDAKPQDRRVVQRIRHPSYRRPSQYNDIALLKLESPVIFNVYVRPACLSLKPQLPTGEETIVAGWGLIDLFDNRKTSLQKVSIPVVAPVQCRTLFRNEPSRLPDGINEASQLCAGIEGKDTCQGDSGGPLAVFSSDEKCMYEVVGVTSFGKACGTRVPGVYTKIFNYLSWIESIVWPNLI